MRIRLKKRLRIRIASPYGVPNIDALKRQVSLVEIVRFHLGDDGIEMADKVMFQCRIHPERHSHGDDDPSLWCYDDYHETGIGRWGCPTCVPAGDDVYGFLRQLHGYSMAEALRAVQVWRLNHSPSIRVRLRQSPSVRKRRRG